MQFYFFGAPDKTYQASFDVLALKQNTITIKLFSVIIAIMCGFCLTIDLFIHFDRLYSHEQYVQLKAGNFYMVGASVVCYLILVIGRKLDTVKRAQVYKVVCIAYGFVVMSGCLWLSFISQHSPRNTMTMMLVGLLVVSTMWILNLRQVLLLGMLILVAFLGGLKYFQTSEVQLLSNYIVGSFLVVAFFLISRINYSYHYNHFIQLNVIKTKTREIRKINRAQSEILGIVAHDLRSPVNSIRAIADLLIADESTQEERLELYNMIVTACLDSDSITRDLMEVARKTDEPIALADVDMGLFMRQLQHKWQHNVPGSRRLTVIDADEPIMARIHPQKMTRVLDNLVTNAIKFTNDQGSIAITLSHDGDDIKITVADDGIGIPEKLKPHMFERFSKAGRRGVNGERSYGLGLNICKQIVEQHGGTIWLESQEGAGTTFFIELPGAQIA